MRECDLGTQMTASQIATANTMKAFSTKYSSQYETRSYSFVY